MSRGLIDGEMSVGCDSLLAIGVLAVFIIGLWIGWSAR